MHTDRLDPMHFMVIDWKEPSSWKQGLFGAPHDQTLFG